MPNNEAVAGKAEMDGKVDSFSKVASIVDLIFSRNSSNNAADTVFGPELNGTRYLGTKRIS